MLNRPLAPVRGDVVPDEQEDQSRQTRCDRQSQTEPAYLSDTSTVIIFHLSAGNIQANSASYPQWAVAVSFNAVKPSRLTCLIQQQ